MTIPEHIREEAPPWHWVDVADRLTRDLHISSHPDALRVITSALLAAEQRGMERAAEIADLERIEYERMAGKLGDEDWTLQAKHDHAAEACGDVAAAIRKAREERG